MKSAALIGLLTLALAGAFPAAAQDGDAADEVEDIGWITGMWTSACDDVVPTPVTFDQAMTLPRDQIPECVAVEGLWSFRTLHKDMAARYAPGPDWSGPSQLWFGVYQQPDAPEPDTPVPARLIGKIGDCDDILPDVWMGGYCHYRPGRILILGRSEVLGPTPDRWVGAEARERIGELIEPPADWPNRAYVEAVAAEWLALLKAGDAAAYAARFHSDWIRLDLASELEEPDSVFHAMFASRTSIFEALRNFAQPRLRIWRASQQEEAGEVSAVACYALGDWTEDRWPASSRDAENMPGRPYVCLGINREAKNGGGFYESVNERPYPLALAEPVW